MLELLYHLAVILGINVILAVSLNIINGYCGLFSLGHAGFFAVGAYTAAFLTQTMFPEFTSLSPYMALLLSSMVAMIAAAMAGLVIGVPCLRLTGDYLAIATLGFGEIIRIVIINMDAVGGPRGMPGIAKLTDLPTVVIACLITVFLIWRLMKSSFGRCILAIREDEIAARSMGVDVVFYKVFAFVLASAFAGLAGGLFAHYQQFISPSNFTFLVSVQILTMIVVGGLGSQWGAFWGAVLVTLLPELLRFNDTLSQIRILVFGVILVVMMLWQPAGLMGLFKPKRKLA